MADEKIIKIEAEFKGKGDPERPAGEKLRRDDDVKREERERIGGSGQESDKREEGRKQHQQTIDTFRENVKKGDVKLPDVNPPPARHPKPSAPREPPLPPRPPGPPPAAGGAAEGMTEAAMTTAMRGGAGASAALPGAAAGASAAAGGAGGAAGGGAAAAAGAGGAGAAAGAGGVAAGAGLAAMLPVIGEVIMAIGAFVLVLAAVTKITEEVFDALTKTFEKYSATISIAQAQKDLELTLHKLEVAQRVEGESSAVIAAQTEIGKTLIDIRASIMEIIGPGLTTLIYTLNLILKGVNWFMGVIIWFQWAITKVLWIYARGMEILWQWVPGMAWMTRTMRKFFEEQLRIMAEARGEGTESPYYKEVKEFLAGEKPPKGPLTRWGTRRPRGGRP